MRNKKIDMSSKMKLTPLFDNVLIKPLAAEEKTASGIILPDTAKEKPQIGTVMAIGPGARDEHGKLIPMVVEKNQQVYYKKWGGQEVKVGNEEWMLVEQKDILAIVN